MSSKCILIIFLTISCLCGSEASGFTTRIIYYIHGDDSYLFHDKNGNAARADYRILKQALYVARESVNSEVFILHHRPVKNILFLFTMKNLDFYYYKNGKLINKSSYKPDNVPAVQLEFDLIRKFTKGDEDTTRNFYLFYGHRIPEDEGYGYNSSQPDSPLNIKIVRQALLSYSRNPFELIILSTCKNGTHYSVNQLAGLTRYIIASPEDLSLYHISSLPFMIFNKHPEIKTARFVNILANYSYKKLKENTFTMTTISVYKMNNFSQNPLPPEVRVLYNPPLFGKEKNLKEHSGWGDPDSVIAKDKL